MATLPANFGVPGADVGDSRDSDLRADARTRTGAGGDDFNRLSVSNDGRLYWDDKPVVVRRRLMLTTWQKFGAILIALAALLIALSAALRVAIATHDWMCGAKWVASYCPGPAPAPLPPPPPPKPELPN